jgi:predicted peptidase
MRTAVTWLSPLLLLALAATACAAPSKRVSAMLDKKTFTGPKGGKLPYRLLRPDPYEDGKSYPLVVFLHGAGERGNDNEAQLIHGVPEFDKPENRKKYPCFLVAPQCPAGKKWSDVDWSSDVSRLPPEPSGPGALVLQLIDALRKQYRIDAARIYLTGLSMGGYGTWDLLMRRPDLFAAAVPICGGGDETQAAKIAHIPVWVFHGTLDNAVKVQRSRHMVAALEKAGGRPRYTEYPDERHASWVPAYRSPAMMKWLFAQRKDPPPAPPGGK